MTATVQLQPNSAYREQLERGFRSLRFADPAIESEFRVANRENTLTALRVALVIGAVFSPMFLVVDYFGNGPGFSTPLIALRGTVSEILLLTMLVATFFTRAHVALTPLAVLTGLSFSAGAVILNYISVRSGTAINGTGYIFVTFYIYLFLGLRLAPALLTAGVLIIGSLAVNLAVGTDAVQLAYLLLFMSVSNIIGATGLYSLEYSRRLAFLQRRDLETLAGCDALTGLANRKVFDEHLNRVWAHCRREQAPIVVALIDVDHFKAYNDAYGHQRGDRCLIEVGRIIGGAARRPLDIAARYGGEEFAVVLPDCTLSHARGLLDDLRSRVFELNLRHETSETAGVVTVSVGLASVSPHASQRSPEGILQAADSALYEAKAAGRNRVVYASEAELDLMRTGVFEITGNLSKAASAG